MLYVKCLDDTMYGFAENTAMAIMNKMLYYLNNCMGLDSDARINKTESGQHLYIIHKNKTYAMINRHDNFTDTD